MDSQLASVLTRGSLDVQNGSQCAEGSGPVTKMCVNPEDRVHLPAAPVEDCNSKDLLLIDDQGIPYTLSHDGHKIPQVDISPSSTDPQSDRAGSPGTERTEESPEGTSSGPSFSQSSDTALKESSLDLYPSSTPASDRSLLGTDQTAGPEVMEGMTNPEHSVVVEPNSCVQEAVFNSSSLISTSTQPVQMLTNPSINVPFLLLSPSSSSAPVSLPLSLSVPQSSPGASTPMFLLLSSVPSSSGESTSTSTPIAVLDPSTGQLSQITAASAPISLPLSSGQVGALGSHVSNPVITLSANNAPALVSGTSNVKSSSVLTSVSVPSPVHTQGSAPLSQTHISHSDSNPGSEAIPVKDVSSEMNKQSTVPESSPQAQPSSVTYDPSTQPSSEASAHTPASESNVTPSDHLPLDDHRYFTNTAAPPSPPIGPMFPPANLDPLDPLDPISPSGSPDSMNSRRVLYCPLCPRVFFYLSDLERHAITHSQKKPHVCQQCGKAFKRSSHLQRHKHIHTGQRNFVCPICAKRFREAGELQRHQRVHTGEKPYQCQLCHTRFAERNTLRRHTKRKHPYHQAAMEMLSERKDRGGGGRRDDGEVGGSAVQEEEESAEWYSSTVSNLEHSESEVET
ncbi:flocculation protein FLO11 isoform X2 [Gouania willdenowi]|uniref:flocculation protein FLO11 isoform X2 n=1 Tax=Gouania willdenowi TaxID=441366 RepID=UPI001056088B|nr:flocculation protein FLO11-like isoform X2 [Gouania willdenowi]